MVDGGEDFAKEGVVWRFTVHVALLGRSFRSVGTKVELLSRERKVASSSPSGGDVSCTSLSYYMHLKV